ncbi:CoA-transferase family III domain-containing protein [Cokeromyces recurvatus]|uniref:CoA-transferase family III domain-containing protein n=1 Tax=Cokeromyces recurvatus TaxID=90255 RepID=UPI00221F6AA8|nr:CoA-transferase family III domain-containing protein [Cokeromyces recurvatus]KAI7898098.1 CoA-transferase family III domain-containing protein [Cokeromyces recurvatus]
MNNLLLLRHRLILKRTRSVQQCGFSSCQIHFRDFIEKKSKAGPLEGIRVLDLTRVLAGPYCTMMLGDLGADVIKVENPKGGDDTRAWGPPFATHNNHSESAYFLCVNRNKRSMTVNMKSSGGRKVIEDLVRQSDVLVENYLPGKLEKLGLGYQQLQKINPKLIYASITGYGQTGPYANRPGYDVIIEAEAGLMHITGEQDGRPVKVGVAITDLTTGLYAHSAILAALIQRGVTGRGQHIDCSLIESQVASLANIASNFLIGQREATRMGTSHPSIVPYQVFPTLDSFVMIGAGNDGQFAKLCDRLDLQHLVDNPKFKRNTDRVKHRTEMIRILEERFQQATTAEWLKKLDGSGFPFAPIHTIQQTFEHPQIVARGLVHEIEHETVGKIKIVGPPVKFSEAHTTVRLPPPVLGAHTNDILSNVLGYSKTQIDQLLLDKSI